MQRDEDRGSSSEALGQGRPSKGEQGREAYPWKREKFFKKTKRKKNVLHQNPREKISRLGKPGHKTQDCRHFKDAKRNHHINIIEDFVAVIKANMVSNITD